MSELEKLRCECGEALVVVDDNGSIACPANCGWEGIYLEPVLLFLQRRQADSKLLALAT